MAEIQIERKRVESEEQRLQGALLECQHWIGKTPEGQAPEALLASMNGVAKEIVEAKGGGGIGSLAPKG